MIVNHWSALTMNDSKAELFPPKFRIAPTPSGFLHQGNITSFILTWALSKAINGKLLLRIDDLDRTRFRPVYLDDIFRKLEHYKLDYDEGPSGPDDFNSSWSQTTRSGLYHDFLKRLSDVSELFACSCSRSEIAEGKICECRNNAIRPEDFALKISTSGLPPVQWNDRLCGQCEVCIHQHMPDIVIRKKDHTPAYQLTSLVDDVHFGVTDIVRGKDLVYSTAAQLTLARLLQEERFMQIRFYHHPLLLTSEGIKLSKSAGDGLPLHSGNASDLPDESEMLHTIYQWIQLPYRPETKEDLINALRTHFCK